MRKRISFALVAVALLLVTAASFSYHAQNAGAEIVVKVEFPFVVGEKAFPAGSYRITAEGGSAALTIRAVKGNENMAVPVVTRLARARNSGGGHDSNLVFDKVEDRMFLSEVWLPGRDGYLVRGTAEEHQHEVVEVKS